MSSLTSMSIYRWILIRYQVGMIDIGRIIIDILCREQYKKTDNYPDDYPELGVEYLSCTSTPPRLGAVPA